MISSISGYTYCHNDDTINVNQYVSSEGVVSLSGNRVTLVQTTQYPWEGDITIQVRPQSTAEFTIKLRIPGWATGQPLPGNLYKYLDRRVEPIELAVNESPIDLRIENGYVAVQRRWEAGDTLRLSLPMPIRRVIAHPRAIADKGLVAIERGPIVYCAEFKDNDIDIAQLKLSDDTTLSARFEKDLFGGAVTITSDQGLKLIPYFLYANRGPGWMRVWLPRAGD